MIDRERIRKGRMKARRVARIEKAKWDTTKIDWDLLEKKYFATRVPCSCTMCGNPRRHWGEKTIQELKAEEAMEGAIGGGF